MQLRDVAIAVLHQGGAELDRRAAEREEMRRRLVVHGAAVARDGHAEVADPGQGEVADRRDAGAAHAEDDALVPLAARVVAEAERRPQNPKTPKPQNPVNIVYKY